MSTKIAWCDETWNPIVGCSKVSAGCANCYAETMAKRLRGMGLPRYQGVVNEKGWTGQIALVPEALDKPLHWRKPRRVFVGSMTDLFHPDVPFEYLDRIWATMLLSPAHTFQVLTKRPDRMRQYLDDVPSVVFPNTTIRYTTVLGAANDIRFRRPERRLLEIGISDPVRFPSPNVHLGVTIERPEFSYRSTFLGWVPAALRFVSFEPLLGSFADYPGVLDDVDWAIIGCESGPKRRPMQLEWALDLVEQCKVAGVAVFVKQLDLDGKVSHDPAEWPEELRVREYPFSTESTDNG